jgi:hypothetical protein
MAPSPPNRLSRLLRLVDPVDAADQALVVVVQPGHADAERVLPFDQGYCVALSMDEG